MISPARWRAGLLLLLATFMTQGCKLPSSQPDQVPLILSMSKADTISIHEQDTLEVVARDAQGRQVADPRIAWTFSGPCCGGSPATVLEEKGPEAVLVGQFPATLYVKANIADPRFTANTLTTQIPVKYGPIAVRFVGVGSDTLLTSQGGFTVEAHAVDQSGAEMSYGNFVWTTRNGLVRPGSTADSILHMSALGVGEDTVYLTHTLCPNECADTLAVSLKPIATGINLDSSLLVTSLRDTVQLAAALHALVHDAAGYGVPNAPITWQLANPADSEVLELLAPSTGTAATRSNGTAQVELISGSFEAKGDVHVDQLPNKVDLQAPWYVVGVGTPFTASYTAFDAKGAPIPLSHTLQSTWGIIPYPPPNPVGWKAYISFGPREVTLTTPDYGVWNIILYVSRCDSLSCGLQVGTDSAPPHLYVIAQPDSVQAYPQDGSTTLSGMGTTATWLGNIFLPDSTITGVPLEWTSLDSAVATIDMNGLVTAVSPGTARIVGTMGTVADTSVVTVVGPSP